MSELYDLHERVSDVSTNVCCVKNALEFTAEVFDKGEIIPVGLLYVLRDSLQSINDRLDAISDELHSHSLEGKKEAA